MTPAYVIQKCKLSSNGKAAEVQQVGTVVQVADEVLLKASQAGFLRKIDGILPYDTTAAHQRYRTTDGEVVPGGSTIAKIGDDPGGLIHWAWQQGVDGKDYKKVRDEAADIGTMGHHMVEAFYAGKWPDVDKWSTHDRERATWAYVKFCEWWGTEQLKWSPEIIEPEMQFVSDAYRYGGTLDAPCRDAEGRAILVDWKTSKAVYDSHIFQLAGYENLWNEHHPKDRIVRRAIIRIGKQAETGDFEARWISDYQIGKAWECFKAKLHLWRTLRDWKK